MSWIVVKSFSSNYPNPIHFQVGDYVQVGKIDDEFPGWIWVTTADGNQGWAPIQYLQINVSDQTAICTKGYSAQELNTRIGDVVTLQYELNDWGWVENEEHCSGWVPMENIQLIDKK